MSDQEEDKEDFKEQQQSEQKQQTANKNTKKTADNLYMYTKKNPDEPYNEDELDKLNDSCG